MRHLTLPRFWRLYHGLPDDVQSLADKNYALLKSNPYHPSLHFKKVGLCKQAWSVRVGEHHRALGRIRSDDIVWFWIGTHGHYDDLLTRID